MMDVLYGIVDFIVAIANFVVNFFMSIVWVVNSIPSFVSIVTALFAYCPTFLLVFLEISIALMVLFAVFKVL